MTTAIKFEDGTKNANHKCNFTRFTMRSVYRSTLSLSSRILPAAYHV